MKTLTIFVWDHIFSHEIANTIIPVHYVYEAVDTVVNPNQGKLTIT